MSEQRLRVWIDGCCEDINPGGTASYGLLVKRNGTTLLSEGMIVGSGKAMSNNVAEYAALNRFLDWYLQSGLIIPNIAITERPTIYSDSQLLINQMNGIWKARGGLYYPHYAKAKNTIIANRLSLAFWWIPREQNSEADELSKEPLIKAGIKFRIQPQ